MREAVTSTVQTVGPILFALREAVTSTVQTVGPILFALYIPITDFALPLAAVHKTLE
jgi:hypothetical protein